VTNANLAPSSLAPRRAAGRPAGPTLSALAAMVIGPTNPRRRRTPPRPRRIAPSRSALVIGGGASQQRFCQTFLEALGLRVVVAYDFQAAARALAAQPHQLVILDSQTRGFDPDVWSRLLEATAASFGLDRLIYVVAEAPSERPPIAADGYIERPVRAIDLVRATEPLR